MNNLDFFLIAALMLLMYVMSLVVEGERTGGIRDDIAALSTQVAQMQTPTP